MNRVSLAIAIGVLLTGGESSFAQPELPFFDSIDLPEVRLPYSVGRSTADNRVWASSEYLLWWIKDAPLPVPLVAAGPPVANLAPILSRGDFTVLTGGSDIDYRERSGGRFIVGFWLDDEQTLGTEGSYFFLGGPSIKQRFASSALPGSPTLAIPFFNVTASGESSTRIALTGGFAGVADLNISSWLQGFEWNADLGVVRSSAFRVDLIGGFRHLNLHERLDFNTNSPSIVPPIDVFKTFDTFDAQNNFYGGQLGARIEYLVGRLSVCTTTKVALGTMQENVHINGQLVTNDFNPTVAVGAPQPFPAGYLALPTNNGSHSKSAFAVVPTVDVHLGYQILPSVRLLLGYSFLYVSDVARPGNQIDRGINPSQVPAITGVASTAVVGPARPTPLFNSSDLWAQGIDFGVEVRY